MANEIPRLQDRGSESEKITINLGYVDLGHIDLLVQDGFYSNRTDFIRTAIRNHSARRAACWQRCEERPVRADNLTRNSASPNLEALFHDI